MEIEEISEGRCTCGLGMAVPPLEHRSRCRVYGAEYQKRRRMAQSVAPHGPRNPGQPKKSSDRLRKDHPVSVTDEAWRGLKKVAESIGCDGPKKVPSVSELMERIGRGALRVYPNDQII